ncbi:hypothetical protein BH09PLA1_BH09PLA1_29380 [soil metagenome]
MLCIRLGKSIVCAAAMCAVSSVAQGDLTIDLRATTVNGAALSGGQTQHAIPNAQIGDVIAFDVFALVTGTDANFMNDRFLAVSGSFRSSALGSGDNLLGNLLLDVVRTQFDPETGDPVGPLGFDNLGFSAGTQQDLDGDGDLDVGSNNTSAPANYWAARAYLVTSGGGYGVPAGLPNGRKIGVGCFNVTSTSAASQTLLRFAGRNIDIAATYNEDGIVRQGPSLDSLPGKGIVVSSIPEPASVTTIAARLLVLHRRRR